MGANGQITCDECKQGVTALGQYLQTPNEIAAVEQALSDLVCPTLPEDKIEACIEFVYTNWEAMATALFAYENTLTDICGPAYCDSSFEVSGDPATCKEWIELMGVQA